MRAALNVNTISIHVPREGNDEYVWFDTMSDEEFLSTFPARGTTERLVNTVTDKQISIHVPREGNDS